MIYTFGCLMAFALVNSIQGQPVINYNSHAPQIGDVNSFYIIPMLESVDPGPAGEGVVWDFSQYTSSELYTDNYIDPSVTPFSGQLQNCNLAVLHDEPNQTGYTFCSQDNAQMSHIAGGWDDGDQLFYWDFSDPVILRTYPFGFNDQHTDNYAYTMDFNQAGQDLVIEINGTLTSLADAYGTISTATGTYENVLRVKTTYTDLTKTYMMGSLINTATTTTYYYEWFTSDSKFSIFQVMHIEDTEDSFSIHYASGSSGIDDLPGRALMVYPNPSTGNIIIAIDNPEEVTKVELTDSKGRLINILDPGLIREGKMNINITGVKAGLYFIKIIRVDGRCHSRKFLVSR